MQPLGEQGADPAGGLGFAFLDRRRRTIRVVLGDVRRTANAPDPERADRPFYVNIDSCDVDADVAFFEAPLGFSKTDRSEIMGFVRTNSEHHSVVLAEGTSTPFNHGGWKT